MVNKNLEQKSNETSPSFFSAEAKFRAPAASNRYIYYIEYGGWGWSGAEREGDGAEVWCNDERFHTVVAAMVSPFFVFFFASNYRTYTLSTQL
jgi:hypothetical protein